MIRGGKSLVSSPPAFSNDAKKLLVCTGNTVSVFSTSTGLLITELEAHTAPVTSVIVVPASTPASKISCYCWTASHDGNIRYWDFSGPDLIKTIDIKLPIFSMVIPNLVGQILENDEKGPDLFAYISTGETGQKAKEPNGLHGKIQKCNLTKSRLAGGVILAETQKPEHITICSSGKYFGIIDKRKLRIWNVPARDAERIDIKKIRLHHTKTLNTLAFHPTERIVAAGDVTGRILIWRNFGERMFTRGDKLISGGLMNNEDEKPGVRDGDDAELCTTWHWHSSGVRLLLFSSDGAYLYSGGKEGVLVVWQLDTGKKKFLPRIGAPLNFFIISPDPSLSSISCADNQIRILKMPSMEILKCISGIKLRCSVAETCKSSASGFVFKNTTGVVAICAQNYCIQFYSLFDDSEISEVQVCERNHQPGDKPTVTVNLVALSLDGSVMGTVETWPSEEGMGGHVNLKFWMCGSLNKDFTLSTIVYEPHRDAGISAVAFHPTRRMAVSSSYGGDFKIWVCNNASQLNDKTGWACHAVGSYKKKPLTAATFSVDGSVLAVAAETVITLWDPEKNILVAVIGDSLEPIVDLSFVGKSNYLVSRSQGSSPQVSVWSMSNLSSTWSYKLHAEAIACTPYNSSFAVLALLPQPCGFTENSKKSTLQSEFGAILLFNGGDPVPVATWFVKKAVGGGLVFLQRNSVVLAEKTSDGDPTSLLLAYMNGDHEYVIFDPYGEDVCKRSFAHWPGAAGSQETGQFGYASLYGELPEFDIKQNWASAAPFVGYEKPQKTIFGDSSNRLPLAKLCSTVLESMMEKRTADVD